jgi:hypothetical protein
MPVSRILAGISLAIVGIAGLIAGIGLLHELTSGGDLHMLLDNLERWMVTVGFYFALIVLSAATIDYLSRKK